MANSNNLVNPNAREAMDRFKMEAASQVGVADTTKLTLLWAFLLSAPTRFQTSCL